MRLDWVRGCRFRCATIHDDDDDDGGGKKFERAMMRCNFLGRADTMGEGGYSCR
jgi:hypothetical protein